MAKYCGKCGTMLDEQTGLCPKCSRKESVSNGKKPRRTRLWVLVGIFAAVAVSAAVLIRMAGNKPSRTLAAATETAMNAVTEPQMQTEKTESLSLEGFPSCFILYGDSTAQNSSFELNPDGTFRCQIRFENWFDCAEAYPRGICKISSYEGAFSEITQEDPWTYKLHIRSLTQTDEPGTEYIKDKVKFQVVEQTDITGLTDAYLFLPEKIAGLRDGEMLEVNGESVYTGPSFGYMEETLEGKQVLYMGLSFPFISTEEKSEKEPMETANNMLAAALDLSKAWSHSFQYELSSGHMQNCNACFAFDSDGTLDFALIEPFSDMFWGANGTYSVDEDIVTITLDWSHFYEKSAKPTIRTGEYRFDPAERTLTQLSKDGATLKLNEQGTVFYLRDQGFNSKEEICQIAQVSAEKEAPVLMANAASGTYVFGRKMERSEIKSITVVNSLKNAPDNAWDVSAGENGSVRAWLKENGDKYDLYIGAEGKVYAPEDCSDLFLGYENAEKIDLHLLDTSRTVTMRRMFAQCGKLEKLNVTGFDTQNVEDFSSMFRGCSQLKNLDLRGFDTRNAKDMMQMFFGFSEADLGKMGVYDWNYQNVEYLWEEAPDRAVLNNYLLYGGLTPDT